VIIWRFENYGHFGDGVTAVVADRAEVEIDVEAVVAEPVAKVDAARNLEALAAIHVLRNLLLTLLLKLGVLVQLQLVFIAGGHHGV